MEIAAFLAFHISAAARNKVSALRSARPAGPPRRAVADMYGLTVSQTRRRRYDTTLLASIDPGGRLSLGRIERRTGMRMERAFVFASPNRLVVRFSNDVRPPPGWVEAPVIRLPGRYPHLRLTGQGPRALLTRARLSCPVGARVKVVVEAGQCIVEAV